MARTLINRCFRKAVSMKERSIINLEDGNVLIVSLILLVLLTMLGISATRTSSIDMQVAGNNMTYKRNLFTAEAAAYQAVQIMEETDLVTDAPNWLLPEGTSEVHIGPPDRWENGFPGGTAGSSSIDSDPRATTRFIAIRGGIVETGESLDMTRTKINEFSVYGRCDRNRGTSIVKVGYRKAY